MFFSLAKAQSAVEYLMTYGWMLLVVAITGSVIFTVASDQSVESVSGFSGSDVVVDDFGVTEDDDLQLYLRSSTGQGATVEAINVTDQSTGEYVYKEFSRDNEISVGESLVLGLPNVSRSNGSNSLDVRVIYNSGNLENLGISGSISGELKVDETSEVNEGSEGGNDDNANSLSEPSVGGEWSLVTPDGAEGGYDYFFNSSTTPYGSTYGGNSSVEYDGQGFYIMKYQAAQNSSDNSLPASNGDAGWNSISFNDGSAQSGPSAYTACENLDVKTSDFDVHLMTNREWMTVARQVAQRPENWADGSVGSTGSSGGLYQGNHGTGDNYDRAVNLGDSANNANTGKEQRTHNLSSGDQVWDLSGDLSMWVDAGENGSAISAPDADSNKIYERKPKSTAVNESPSSLGVDNGFSDGKAGARSGPYIEGLQVGVFYADSFDPSFPSSQIGFRCSAVPSS